MLNSNVEIEMFYFCDIDSFWNHVCFDRIYWSFWTCFIEKLCFISWLPKHQAPNECWRKRLRREKTLHYSFWSTPFGRKWEEVVSVDTEVMTEELATQISCFLSHLQGPPTIGSLLKQWLDWGEIMVTC